jgi:hypothetical protein
MHHKLRASASVHPPFLNSNITTVEIVRYLFIIKGKMKFN